MALSYVTLTGTLPGAAGALAVFTPSNWLTDATDQQLEPPVPVPVTLTAATVNGIACGVFSKSLLATDNANLPSGWYWTVNFSGIPGVAAYSFSFNLAFASGATQDISTLATLPSPVPVTPYMPVPSGIPQAGQAPIATGTGEASAWGNILQLDGTASDIQPLGTAAAGNSGKAADAKHVHPSTGMLVRQAATSASGFALQNGTPTILSWAVPNDGQQHEASIFASIDVTSPQTGGGVICSATAPDGSSSNFTIIQPGLGAGFRVNSNTVANFIVGAGTTVSLQQQSAQTGGAATVWATIRGA